MKLRLALAAATCLALPIAAHAQPVTGPYVSLEGGTSILNSVNAAYGMNIPQLQAGFKISGKNHFRPSYAGVAGLGYGFGNGFRVELDGELTRNTRQSIGGTAAVTQNNVTVASQSFRQDRTGGLNKYGPMLNVLYDIPVAFPVQPYVGAGVGYQWIKLNSDFVLPLIPLETSGTRGSFAYDVIAGISYPLAFVPGLSLTGEYRFMQLTSSENFNLNIPSGVNLPPGFNTKIKFGQESSHTFLVGLRYQLFNPPPAAPAPAPAPVAAAPAPVPARTYLVFFDWDKASLTPRATQIIAQAASDSKTQTTTMLSVSGYTDTSGTPVYNQGLSMRRAKAVAGQLVTDGVPASEIEIHAYGETHLLVPTGPNVREPQNRRVEIVLN